MQITRNQWLALISLLLGLMAGGGATMTELFGQGLAVKVGAAAGFLNSFVSGTILILSGQGQQVQDVRNLALNPATASAATQKALVEATSAVIGSSAAGPAITHEAKVAIIDAAANLPEVVGDIHVTDKALVSDTLSTQVKAAT